MNTFPTTFWDKLEDLAQIDVETYSKFEQPDIPRDEILSRIEDEVVSLVHQISNGDSPCLQFRNRSSWKNAMYLPNVGLKLIEDPNFTTISFGNEGSVNKFGLTVKLLSMIYKLIQSGQVATKRDLYYEEPNLFSSQSIVDHIVDDISCMICVPRRWLNVVATSKGLIAGDLQFVDPDGHTVDCSLNQSGSVVPVLVDNVSNIKTQYAKFVLVIEKDATFQRLLDQGFTTNMPCVLVTGKGVPDVNTRILIRKIWNELEIPVFGLMDADPHGIEIMCVYRFGSLSQSHDVHSLALPFMKWIGVFPSDITRLRLPDDVTLPLSDKDKSKCRDILARPYIEYHAGLAEELHNMLRCDRKAEIQALMRFSPNYLAQVFIPSKIKNGNWI
ncbi:meiotic recombination protein SPO11 [Ciona intestinalis]